MDQRSTKLNDKAVRSDALYVLVWLQQSIRGHLNPVIEAALKLANERRLPVLVYHGKRRDYPYASARLHTFMLEAARELERTLGGRGIACAQYFERPGHEVRGLVYKLAADAAAVFTDEQFVFVAREQARRFASKADVAVIAVDEARLIPTHLFGGEPLITRSFRARHTPLRAVWRDHAPDRTPCVPPYDGKLPFKPDRLAQAADKDLRKLAAACRVDDEIPASHAHPGTSEAIRSRLGELTENVARYGDVRNNPALPWSCSQLSPYLHFGLLSVYDILKAVDASNATGSAKWKFLDEFLTWREWSHHLAYAIPDIHRYSETREWSREMLSAHAGDPREPLPLEALMRGETPDEVWNASQRFWLATGWLHNNLRMYWAKQILKWTASPEAAWAVACYINDRVSLDGRDPATYASMRWAFGDASPGDRRVPIYGLVSTKSATAILKREGMRDWIAENARLQVPHIRCAELSEIIELYR
jgi:deoxyribodipyrimidine photo-lyase